MCKPASMIVVKDGSVKVLWSSNTDSHEEIISEFNLNEGSGRINFVRIEISPEDENLASDPATWKFKTDQQEVPSWYDSEEVEKLSRVELKKWIEKKVVIGERQELRDGQYYLTENSTVGEMRENSKVGEMWANSTVGVMWANSKVGEMWANSKVGEMWANSKVGEMRENSKVGEMRENSTVGVMRENSTVGVMRENSTVGECHDETTISVRCKMDRGCLQSVNAVMIDRSGPKVKCYVGRIRRQGN